MSKVLILDYNTWRSGGNPGEDNAVGKGSTMLLNEEGYMCCLGQWIPQLNPEVQNNDLLDEGEPCNITTEIELLSITNFDGDIVNTEFSDNAIAINDNTVTTPKEKINGLRVLLSKQGYELNVINEPN